MRLTRLMAFRERATCAHGHQLDVWVRPRAPGTAADPMRCCPTCGTLFVVTSAAPVPALARPALEHDDGTCPGCRTPFAQSRAYPEVPRCDACAALITTWLTEGPDLPASAVGVVRCWAVSPTVIDLRDPTSPAAQPVHRAAQHA